jgi:hypothetical protein
MASPIETNQKSSGRGPVELRQRRAAYGLIVLAAVLAAAVGWLAYKYRAEYFTVNFALGLLAALYLVTGLYWLWRERASGETDENTRLSVLSLLGFSGLIITAVGLALAWHWWDVYLDWLKAQPGKEGWRMWLSLIAIIGGLAVMFAGLQLGRTSERSNPLLRRLLYGYNAALGALLVLLILGVGNVLGYVKLTAPIDFTASSMYTLSSRSKNLLQSLDKPIKIYVLLVRGTTLELEMDTLLSNCRRINDRIQLEYLSPDLDPERIAELGKRYSFTAREGVLVVYGSEGSENHQFISAEDLYSLDQGRSKDLKFKGEDALMSALNSLAEGKAKPVIYFTQGHGELDINDTTGTRLDQGAGLLRGRLEKRNYDVKPLNFSPADPKVPDDAAIVVIARPTDPYSPGVLKALREYMNPTKPNTKPGKLLVLVDVPASGDVAEQSGIESFLGQFNVRVGNERVLGLRYEAAPLILARFNPQLVERNPIASLFEGVAIRLYSARPVRPSSEGEAPAANGRYQVEPLLMAMAAQGIWAEPNLKADPNELAAALRKDRKELEAKLSETDIPVGVAVSEATANPDPHSFMRPPEPGKPRMVVYGDATMACNQFMNERTGNTNYELIANTLDWLRERPQNLGIEPKNRNVFTLSPDTSVARMILLPGALMFLGIIGLGVGVWAVRRQ